MSNANKTQQMKELMALADIREALGVGHKPMLSELVEMIRELVRDKARLDWLIREEMIGGMYIPAGSRWAKEINTRADIDAAMGEEVES